MGVYMCMCVRVLVLNALFVKLPESEEFSNLRHKRTGFKTSSQKRKRRRKNKKQPTKRATRVAVRNYEKPSPEAAVITGGTTQLSLSLLQGQINFWKVVEESTRERNKNPNNTRKSGSSLVGGGHAKLSDSAECTRSN